MADTTDTAALQAELQRLEEELERKRLEDEIKRLQSQLVDVETTVERRLPISPELSRRVLAWRLDVLD